MAHEKYYERYCHADEKVKRSVSQLPWRHNILLMQKVTDMEAVYYYATQSIACGWTRDVLLNQIKAHAYEANKTLPKQHNFRVLPEHLQEQAAEMIKSRYNLDFLGIGQPVREKELENRLIEKIKYFILELGKGFCYIGNQYRLTLDQKEYFVEMQKACSVSRPFGLKSQKLKCAPKFKFLLRQLKHKVRRKSFDIPLYRLVQITRCHLYNSARSRPGITRWPRIS